jgi:hypothetical protein
VSFALVHKFSEGSYDVVCQDCHDELATDRDYDTAAGLADKHNRETHPCQLDMFEHDA